MEWDTRQKPLVLILARDMATRLASPMFVVDAHGTLVFFNEAAEAVLGQTFADAGELPAEDWAARFSPEDEGGRPLPLRELPLGVALFEGRPAHRTFRIRGADGVDRDVAATGIPLRTHPDELVGALALFWDRADVPEDDL